MAILIIFIGIIFSLGEAVHVFQFFLKWFHDDRYISQSLIQYIPLIRLSLSDILIDMLEFFLHDFESSFLSVGVILGGFCIRIELQSAVNGSDCLSN